MDWKEILFNTDHSFNWQDAVLLAVILIGFNVWKNWYENKRRREKAQRESQSRNTENPAWHPPKKKKRSKK